MYFPPKQLEMDVYFCPVITRFSIKFLNIPKFENSIDVGFVRESCRNPDLGAKIVFRFPRL